jgi:peptidoglycan/xylan/chitin deacetylase (PgdA/CDA1 family)
MKKTLVLFSILFSLYACNNNETTSTTDSTSVKKDSTANNETQTGTVPVAERHEVPILCYHQIRDWAASDSKGARDYIIPVQPFKDQMQMLADSGYHSILPDQLMAYLTKGTPLPSKPVMITFDDTDDDQFVIAKPELDKHKFKGVFFLMTVSIGRPKYMTKEQIKQLADEGHQIAAHTWDHHMVTKYDTADYTLQLKKPKATIEAIIGKKVDYFAYPFGLWNDKILQPLKDAGYTAAFQLASKKHPADSLLTIRRIIASGYWDNRRLMNAMKGSFH